MALANLTCGSCGAPLTLRDTVCPSCKATVELPRGEEQTGIACEVCGYPNAPAAEYCASCGARLAAGGRRAVVRDAAAPQQARRPVQQQPVQRQRRPEGARPQGAAATRRDPWPLVAVAAIVALVGVVVYTQWDRSAGSTRPGAPVQQQLPGTGMPASSPAVDPAEVMRLEQAVQAKPDDLPSLLRLANLLHDGGQFSRAVETYRKYLRLQPKDPDARVDMGICYYQMGLMDSSRAASMFASAIQEMRTAYAGTPTHQPAAFNLGIVYLQAGNLDSSNIWFKRAVVINKASDLGTRAQRIIEQHMIAQ